jgi:diaminopimelate epimerase
MGRPTWPQPAAAPEVAVGGPVGGGRTWPATPVALPNPHAVAFVEDLADAGPLAVPPRVGPAGLFPAGVNVEFVVVRAPGHLAMRVHERGVGETRSCGTGACAAVVAARRREGDGSPRRWRVDVPGGAVHVEERPDGEVVLSGPAVVVAEGALDERWLADHP